MEMEAPGCSKMLVSTFQIAWSCKQDENKSNLVCLFPLIAHLQIPQWTVIEATGANFSNLL
jgi:hypothetical protein